MLKFQSTRPRGARLVSSPGSDCIGNGFNPRARVGRDINQNTGYNLKSPFQSTRPRGARQILLT